MEKFLNILFITLALTIIVSSYISTGKLDLGWVNAFMWGLIAYSRLSQVERLYK